MIHPQQTYIYYLTYCMYNLCVHVPKHSVHSNNTHTHACTYARTNARTHAHTHTKWHTNRYKYKCTLTQEGILEHSLWLPKQSGSLDCRQNNSGGPHTQTHGHTLSQTCKFHRYPTVYTNHKMLQLELTMHLMIQHLMNIVNTL